MTIALFLAAVALQSAPASPPPEKSDVTVTGRRAAEPATVREFVNSVTLRSGQQVARFHDEVCPVALGLPDASARVVENRIRETALGVGARVAASGKCNANLLLIIAEDGGRLVRDIRANRADWLSGLTSVQVRRLIDEPSPARAWTVTSLRNADGRGMGQTGSNAASEFKDHSLMRVMSASIINLPTRADIDGAVIVIDKAAVVGLSLAQIADYAAMRGLARTRAPSTARIGTILGLFAKGAGEPPLEMTGADIAYLQALYRSAGHSSALDERHRIARELTKR